SIRERPLEADGTRFGDWEMDLIVGKGGKGAILTLTERSSNLLLMEKLPDGKKAASLPRVVNRLLFPYRGKGVRTITTDNGGEFACHELIEKKLRATVYFTDSYCSWQKGAIENANKLVRQYIPKGTDFNTVSDRFVMEIQKKINCRPREKLGFRSPKEYFFEKWEQQKRVV
ncbi:IS30 family transposase, partial [Parabacteroides johnsonii]